MTRQRHASCLKWRYAALVALSDSQEVELLSIALLKGGKKVVVGSQEGILDIWSWRRWADIYKISYSGSWESTRTGMWSAWCGFGAFSNVFIIPCS